MLALGTSHRPNTSYLDNQVTNLSLQFLGIGLHGHLVSLPHLPKHILHLPRPPHLVSRQDDHTLIVVHPVHTLGGTEMYRPIIHATQHVPHTIHSMLHSALHRMLQSMLHSTHYTGCYTSTLTEYVTKQSTQYVIQQATLHVLHSTYRDFWSQ